MRELTDKTTIVVGASRGLGRGIAAALAESGAPVVALARTQVTFHEMEGVKVELGDASDAEVAGRLLDDYEPWNVVLVAGATPPTLPLQQQTWETFSVNWHTDVRIAFQWLRAILLKPLRPGSRVVVFSSGAALNGSPLSGGYAGAKATQRFITGYAQEEADREAQGVTFSTVFPRFAPETDVGRVAVRAYAARAGVSVEDYLAPMGPLLTPEIAGAAMVELMTADAPDVAPEYLLTGAGLAVWKS